MKSLSAKAFVLLLALFSISDCLAQKPPVVPLAQICRATIAVVMSRDIRSVKVDKVESSVASVYYVRPDDKIRWNYKCKVDGDRVIWGASDGRLRDDQKDGKVLFETMAKELAIEERFSDGSMSYKLFPLSQLR